VPIAHNLSPYQRAPFSISSRVPRFTSR
jgi:hypothetical protein